MKKILLLILALLCIVAICSCSNAPDLSSANIITYGEKYYRASDMDLDENERRYFVIYDDGYLEYLDRYYSSGEKSEYIVRCKYEIIDESTLMYFYDSREIITGDSGPSHDTNGLLMFSENVLYASNGTAYVRGSYANEELPNFGK